jgi:hypothetical protein
MNVLPNDNHPPAGDRRRVNSPTTWIVCSVVLVALIGTLFFYNGGSRSVPANPATPNVVTGPKGSQ